MMRFVRSGWTGLATVAALSLAVPASADGQVAEGAIVYVEEEDGTLTPHRRVDSPSEGDGVARLVPIAEDEVPTVDEPTAYVVVPREAVLTATGAEITTGEAGITTRGAETEVRAAKADEEPAPRLAEDVEGVRPDIRPRLGVLLHGGGTLGEPEGWLVGGSLSLGVQLGDWFAIYYQPTFLYAELDAPVESDGAFVMWNPLIAEATLFDIVSIGAGPSLDLYEDCEEDVQAQRGCAQDDVYFGLHGRVALNLGGIGPMQRHAFNLTFEVHPTWFAEDLTTVSMLGGIGVQLY